MTDVLETEVEQVVSRIRGWIGWDEWEDSRKAIRLDGQFTAEELSAIVALMQQLPQGPR